MDRRSFLRGLFGVAAVAAAPKIYVLSPPKGWTVGVDTSVLGSDVTFLSPGDIELYHYQKEIIDLVKRRFPFGDLKYHYRGIRNASGRIDPRPLRIPESCDEAKRNTSELPILYGQRPRGRGYELQAWSEHFRREGSLS